jgi:ribosomal protein S21
MRLPTACRTWATSSPVGGDAVEAAAATGLGVVALLMMPTYRCLGHNVEKVLHGSRIGMYVQAREGEPFEELYRRFKRGIEASVLLREYRRKQRFIPAHEGRRDKIRAAARKLRRARAKRPS